MISHSHRRGAHRTSVCLRRLSACAKRTRPNGGVRLSAARYAAPPERWRETHAHPVFTVGADAHIGLCREAATPER